MATKGPSLRGLVAVQRARDELLAGAGFAVDQHGRVRLGKPADGAEHLLHRRRLTEDFGGDGLDRRCTDLGRALRQRPAYQRHGLIDVERFRQIFEGAALEGRHRRIEVGIGGHDDDRQVGVILLDLAQQVEAAGAGHADVGNQHARQLSRRQRRQRLVGRAEAGALDAFASERLFQHPADRAVVVDDPDSIHLFCFSPCAGWTAFTIGRNSVKQVRPGTDSASMLPWCCWTMLCAKASPRPVPPSRPDTSG